MAEPADTVSMERLDYVAKLLHELAAMLPPPRQSLLAHLVDMARLEAENEMARRRKPQR